jgi:hypothetical protein
MKIHYAQLVRVALVYGGLCFLVWWAFGSLALWLFFPVKTADDEFIRLMRWGGHVVGEKIVGLILLSVTAFLASRAHHPTWKWGVATGIAAAVAYEVVAMLVYIMRFGMSSFGEYNDFFYIMSSTVSLAWLFGYLAVRRQCLQEKHAVNGP